MAADTLHYPDGSEIHVGDVVRERENVLVVEAIVTANRQGDFGVDAPGVMLVGLPYGRLFVHERDIGDRQGGIVLVSRRQR